MKTAMITAKVADFFKRLIVPTIYDKLITGLPITAVGLTADDSAIGAAVGVMEDDYVFKLLSL
ncbi:MAG: hypothetical protein K5989_06290, partial [Lachnospiraceae bacterium]|nr:hypothetical protein [Lachnospiraceae bacterium]